MRGLPGGTQLIRRRGRRYGRWRRCPRRPIIGPKRASMAHLTQQDCTAIARTLNQRPRKRLDYRTPEECYVR